MLEIRVHHNDFGSPARGDSLTLGSKSGLLPIVEEERNPWIARSEGLEILTCPVRAPVVDYHNLVGGEIETLDAANNFRKILMFVQSG